MSKITYDIARTAFRDGSACDAPYGYKVDINKAHRLMTIFYKEDADNAIGWGPINKSQYRVIER